MPEYALPVMIIAAVTLWSAWRDYASGNRRDATLLSLFGTGTVLASGSLWFT
jgi:hypothetical protein